MPRPTLTSSIANAAGWDAANKSMRAAGRSKWSIDDWNVGARETNRLTAYLMPLEVVRLMAADGEIDADHPMLAKATS